MAAPGRDCSTTMHSCFTKSGSLLPRGQWTWAQMLSERHIPLTAWLPQVPCSPHNLASPRQAAGFLRVFSERLYGLSRMIPTVSQRVGGRNEGKALRIVSYKDVDINLEFTASEGDGRTWN